MEGVPKKLIIFPASVLFNGDNPVIVDKTIRITGKTAEKKTYKHPGHFTFVKYPGVYKFF